VRRPLGVVASFTPWNGANVLSWRAVISPVAAGNTVVVKPSELAPISAGIILAQIVEEAGFPAGVINVVTHAPGAASEIADVFFESPDEKRNLLYVPGGNAAPDLYDDDRPGNNLYTNSLIALEAHPRLLLRRPNEVRSVVSGPGTAHRVRRFHRS
jgi:hypothetical protein